MNTLEYTSPIVGDGNSPFVVMENCRQTVNQCTTDTCRNKQWISSATSCNFLWQHAATSSNDHWQQGAIDKNSKSNEYTYPFATDVVSAKGLFPKPIAFVFPGQNRPYSLPLPTQYFPTKPSFYSF